MMLRTVLAGSIALAGLTGCASIKKSDTARTGVEQLLISSAIDRSLDRYNFTAFGGAKVYVEEKYLDCVDKNYVIVSLQQRLMKTGAIVLDSADEADIIVRVASGAVGTDRQELFVGVPEIPLPPPSPIAIPRLAILERDKSMGTAKLIVLAYDAKTKEPLMEATPSLARSDHKNWNVLGGGPITSGSVPTEIYAATGESDSILDAPSQIANTVGKTIR